MFSPSLEAVRDKFAQYYADESIKLVIPSSIERREFGFLIFKKGTMLRHKKFGNITALKSFLDNTTPSDIYYSGAYYEDPEKEMEKKGWLGADLVFDIDADHIPTPCDKFHDSWVCIKCGFAGRGPSPEGCPACGGARFDVRSWACDECLESAKDETVKLVGFLEDDFGFADGEISAYFSGNRGYHVHVESEGVRLLDSLARKEIVDYVIGLGFDDRLHGLMEGGRIVVGSNSVGWRRHISMGIRKLLTEAAQNDVKRLGLGKKSADLFKNKDTLLERLDKEGWLDVKGVGPKNWQKIVQWAVDKQSAKIDTVVTTDIHRLIRLAGSLHGKTGLLKMKAPIKGLEAFDPLKEAVAFRDGEMTVDAGETPEFRIGDGRYGPFKNASNVELPTAAAMFLLCKGAAQVVE